MFQPNTTNLFGQSQTTSMFGNNNNNQQKKKNSNNGPKSAQCCQCGQTKQAAYFTKSQLMKKASARRCKQCTGVNVNNAGNNGMGGGSQPQANTTIQCSSCRRILQKNSFSKAQLSKPVVKRKCMQCVGQHTQQLQQQQQANSKKKSKNKGNKGNGPRAQQFLQNTTANRDSLINLNKLLQEGQSYLQKLAGNIDGIGSSELTNVCLGMAHICLNIFAGRGIDMKGKTFTQLVNTLKQHGLFSKKQKQDYVNVLGAAQSALNGNPGFSFTKEQKMMVLETAYALVGHVQDKVLPFICSDCR